MFLASSHSKVDSFTASYRFALRILKRQLEGRHDLSISGRRSGLLAGYAALPNIFIFWLRPRIT